MREWLEAQLATGLPALAGSSISGTVAIKQELLNELLSAWLQRAPQAPSSHAIDPERLKVFVKSAAIRAEPGTLLIDFDIAI